MKTIKRSDVRTINTTFCILRETLDYFGDSRATVGVYDGASPLLAMLGRTDAPVARGQVSFGGFMFEVVLVEGSTYAMLNALPVCAVTGNALPVEVRS